MRNRKKSRSSRRGPDLVPQDKFKRAIAVLVNKASTGALTADDVRLLEAQQADFDDGRSPRARVGQHVVRELDLVFHEVAKRVADFLHDRGPSREEVTPFVHFAITDIGLDVSRDEVDDAIALLERDAVPNRRRRNSWIGAAGGPMETSLELLNLLVPSNQRRSPRSIRYVRQAMQRGLLTPDDTCVAHARRASQTDVGALLESVKGLVTYVVVRDGHVVRFISKREYMALREAGLHRWAPGTMPDWIADGTKPPEGR